MQFDVYQNNNPATKARYPYLLDVQADLLGSLATRIVIPLTPQKHAQDLILTKVMPLFTVGGEKYTAVTPQLAGIAKRDLGVPVANLGEFRTEIMGALDMLFVGS